MEEWKVVEGFIRYEVSNTGRVREIESLREIPQPVNGGFLCANLIGDDGKKVLAKVHRLVAIAFIPNVQGVKRVEHKGDRLVNDVNNLQWRPKVIKEVVEKEVETLTFLNNTYTYPEFCGLAGCEISALRARLKAGWSIRECFTGIKEFTGTGYSVEGVWFPSKKKSERYRSLMQSERDEVSRRIKQEEKESRVQARKEYKKWGVGNFVNHPIPGIVGRKQLKVYRVWSGIISRCYSPKNQNYLRYGGRGVYVCDDWLEFQGFAAWYIEQYKEDDWHIDKDILSGDDVCYSPETCTFVPASINTFFATLPRNEGYLPTLRLDRGGWKVSMSDGDYKYNKTFKTEQEGQVFYKKLKECKAKELAEEFMNVVDVRVTTSLLEFKITLPEQVTLIP